MSTIAPQPMKFKHRCKTCLFLGQYTYKETIYDLYVCINPNNPKDHTFLGRFGNEQDQYCSMSLLDARGPENLNPVTLEAYKRFCLYNKSK